MGISVSAGLVVTLSVASLRGIYAVIENSLKAIGELPEWAKLLLAAGIVTAVGAATRVMDATAGAAIVPAVLVVTAVRVATVVMDVMVAAVGWFIAAAGDVVEEFTWLLKGLRPR